MHDTFMPKYAETAGSYTDEDLRRAWETDHADAKKESKENDAGLDYIQSALEEASRGADRYLSPETAARWYREAEAEQSPRTHFEQIIRPRMNEWRDVRREFDRTTVELEQHGVGRDFTILKPERFWALKPKERLQYLKDAREQLKKPKNFEARWKKISEKVREYAKVTFDELGAASEKETKLLLEGLKHQPKTEEDLKGWEQYVNDAMQRQLQSARSLYYDQLMDKLLGAKNEGLISTRVIRELREKFMDKNVDYKKKESYILNTLPTRIAKWREVKVQRERLLTHPGLARLTGAKVKKLHVFLDDKKFLDMKFPERKGLADMVESALMADEKKLNGQYVSVEKELQSYATDGRMHRSKIGTWMKRVFTANATPEEVDAFMKSTVRPHAGRWLEARTRLNNVNKEINLKGVPRGFNRLPLGQFLLLDYDQRIAYLDEAESRIESDVNAEDELTSLTLGIRHCFDTEDWERAEELLAEAKELDPTHKTVRSMDNYFRTHRPKVTEEKVEEPDPMLILEELREVVGQVPGLLGKMYLKAMSRSPRDLESVLTGAYNLVWVHEHRYSNPLKDMKDGESDFHRDRTRHYIDNGHSRRLEHNVLEGDTADHGAVRDDCKKAQMLHIGDTDGANAAVDKFSQNKENERFKYWSTIHTKDISYEQHRQAVRNCNYKLKTGMRALDKMGYRFTLSGAPQKKGTVSRATSPIKPKKHAGSQYSMSS